MRYETDAGFRDVFLSNSDGHDVAVLQRLRRAEDRNGYRTDDPLSDEQWQKMVDLVAAAPELLESCRLLLEIVESEYAADSQPEDLDSWRTAIALGEKAIARAGR